MVVYPHKRIDGLWTILHETLNSSPRLSAATKATYLRNLDVFSRELGTNPAYWTKDRMISFYQNLRQKMRTKSANSIIKTVTVAIQKYNFLERGPELKDFTRFELEKNEEGTKRQPFSEEEVYALIAACDGRDPKDLRDFAVLVTALETGMRRISLISFRWDKTEELEPGLIVADVRAKRRNSLIVPLTPTVLKSLENWRRWCANNDIRKGPVFRSLVTRGKTLEIGNGEMSEQAIYDIFQTRAEKAGLSRHIHPHLARHTFVSSRHRAKVDPAVIQSVTGHAIPGFSSAGAAYLNKQHLWLEATRTTPSWFADLVEQISNKNGL